MTIGSDVLDLDARTKAAKMAAFLALYWRLRQGPEERLLDVIGTLCRQHGIDQRSLVERLCLDWPAIEQLAQHPLATIGAHTVTHPMLAKHTEETVRRELVQGKSILETRLGRPFAISPIRSAIARPRGPASSGSRRKPAMRRP